MGLRGTVAVKTRAAAPGQGIDDPGVQRATTRSVSELRSEMTMPIKQTLASLVLVAASTAAGSDRPRVVRSSRLYVTQPSPSSSKLQGFKKSELP